MAWFKATISTLEGTEVYSGTCSFLEWASDPDRPVVVPGSDEYEDKEWMVRFDYPPRAQRPTVPLMRGERYAITVEDGRKGIATYVEEIHQPLDSSFGPESIPRFLILDGASPLKRE